MTLQSPTKPQVVVPHGFRPLGPHEPILPFGLIVINLQTDVDVDEDGYVRRTPPGSVGSIYADLDEEPRRWGLAYKNGARLCRTEADLRDPDQYLLYVPSLPLARRLPTVHLRYGMRWSRTNRLRSPRA